MTESTHQPSGHITKEKDTVTIDIQPFLLPIAILFSSIILAFSMYLSAVKISTISISAGGGTATTNTNPTTDTTTTDPAQVTVDENAVKGLFKDGNIVFGDA